MAWYEMREIQCAWTTDGYIDGHKMLLAMCPPDQVTWGELKLSNPNHEGVVVCNDGTAKQVGVL